MHAVVGTGRLLAGRYRLQGPIGRGAMGIVWRGRDELLHRDVAVKEVQITALTMPTEAEVSYQRTLREARTAARLSHPSVVTVFDVVEEDGNPWIVMELAGGRSLDQVIAEDGPLPPLQAAQLGSGLLGALATAHAAGVLHRDVKPGNVLVTAEGRAVLTDFGIATFVEDPGLTQTGMVVGTPGFTAPERIRGRCATPASDLWSLGATLYAAVEGRGPFDRADGAVAISAGVAGEDAPRAPSAGPLGRVIDALLRRDPADRPDAAAAATLLAEASAAAGSGPRASSRRAGSDEVTAALPVTASSGRSGPAPSFLDPPVFADLQMPGAANGSGRAFRPGPADSGGVLGAASAGRGGAATLADLAAGLPECLDPPETGPGAGPPPGPALPPPPDPPPGPPPATTRNGPWSRYWRVATVGTGVAAIVVAAVLGFTIYSHSLTAGSAGSQAPGTGAGGTGAPGSQSGTASGSGPRTSARTGRAGAGGLSSATGGVTSGSGGTAPGGAATSGGAAGTGTTGPAPAGYRWHTVTAASLGTTAGFVIAAPDAWRLRTEGQAAYLDPPTGSADFEISLSPFTYDRPVREARYQQATAVAAGEYPGYSPVAIQPADFRGAAAAAWRFSWTQASAGRTAVLTILVTLPTSAGSQPYALSVSAPPEYFAAARAAFGKSLSTFRPLPPD